MDPVAITEGAIGRIFDDGCTSATLRPVLEVRGYRAIGNNQGRFTVQLADNVHVVRAVTLGDSAISNQFKTGAIRPGTLVRLNNYMVTAAKNAQLLMIQQADDVGCLLAEQRKPDAALRKFGTAGLGMSQMSQADLPMTQLLAAAPAPYTTPERRPTEEERRSAEPTPEPVAPPGPRASEAEMRSSVKVQSFADGNAAGVAASSSWEPNAPQNPYASAASVGQGSGMPPPGVGAFSAPSDYARPSETSDYSRSSETAPVAQASAPHMSAGPPPQMSPYGFADFSRAQQGGSSASAPPPAPRFGSGGISYGGTSSSSAPSRQKATSAASQGGGGFVPLIELSSYSNRWRIKARVLTKSDVRRFTNARGEGQLLKVDLADKSGEMSATFFGKAVDKFGAMLRPGQVYTFSKGVVKAANRKFDKGDHVLTFEEHAEIEPIIDDEEIPGMTYDFKALSEVDQLPIDTLLDVRAVICSVEEPFTFTAKTSQREMTKRTLGLWDASGDNGDLTVDLTLWGERALGQFEAGTVIFAKSARVGEYQQQKNLSSPVQMEISPDRDDAFALKALFDERQKTRPLGFAAFKRATQGGTGARQSLQECKDEDINLGPPAAPGQAFDRTGPRSMHRHSSLATVVSMPNDRGPFYPSCPEMVDVPIRPGADQKPAGPEKRTCNKKTSQENGTWRCAFGHSCQQPVYRYLCRLQVMDHSESLEVNVYDNVARNLFGVEAQEYAPIFENGDMVGQVQQMNQRVEWRRFFWRLRAAKEVWQEAERVRYSVDE
ncbi:unnamed protein product, partial [Polarella glacialis]